MLQIEIIGNLGRDAEIKDFNGRKFIAFTIAHSEKYKDANGNDVEKTTWVSCLKPGESNVVNYLKKGTPVFVRGDLSVKLYMDSNHATHAGINCTVRELQFLPSRKTEAQPQAQQAQQGQPFPPTDPNEELPY